MTDALRRAVDRTAAAKALTAAYERGYRRGTIEARAELTALWRARVADVLTILQAPVPNQAPSKPVQETK